MKAVLTAVCLIALLAGCVSSSGTSRSRASEGRETNSTARLNTQLALGYLEQGKLEVALEKVNRALEADPKLSDAHTVAAVINEQIGEIETAGDHYRSAVRYAPRDGDVLNNYGTFLCKSGELEKAEAHFLQAVDSTFYDTPEVALTNAGNCVSKVPNPDAAQRYYRQALEYNPGYSDALFQLAKVQLDARQCLQARGLIQRFETVAAHSAESLEVAEAVERCNGDATAAEDYRVQRSKLRRNR